jgi:hypothetical protein
MINLFNLSFIIYCLNCVRRDRNSTYRGGFPVRARSSSQLAASDAWALSSNHNAKQLILIGCKHSQRAARSLSFVRGLEIRLNTGLKAWFHERFFSAKCELFRLFLLNCVYSNKLFLLDCSQFKRNRRNISHFAEKKCPWNRVGIKRWNWIAETETESGNWNGDKTLKGWNGDKTLKWG